jgi:hypothetical protein
MIHNEGKIMASKKQIGVLLVDKASGEQKGFIEFDPSGALVYHTMKPEMHVYAFKGIDRILREKWTAQPLYKKHAKSMDKNKKLPDEILEQEANSCADFLNSMESPPTMGIHAVEARVVVREI